MKAALILIFLCQIQIHESFRYPSPLLHPIYQRVIFNTEKPTTQMATEPTEPSEPSLADYQKAFDEVFRKIRKAIHPIDLNDFLRDLETSRLAR